MKVQTRHGVFETNSSSSHSLTIDPKEVRDFSLIEDALTTGVMTIKADRYFGWEWERMYRPENKIAYLMAQAAPSDIGKDLMGISDAAEKLRSANSRIETLFDAVERTTGCTIKLDVLDDFIGVDHESAGLGMNLFSDEKALIDFIFSPDSYIQLGNDNRSSPEMVPSDIDAKFPMYEHLYRTGDAPTGETLSVEFGEIQKELTVDARDKSMWAKTTFCGMHAMQHVMKDLAITDVTVTLSRPEFFNSLRFQDDGTVTDGSEDWDSDAKLLEMARDAFVQGMTNMGTPGQVNFPREMDIKVDVVQGKGNSRLANGPRFKITGISSPETVSAVINEMQEIEAERLDTGPSM